MKVLGYSRKHLTFDDGRSCDGVFLYLGDDSRSDTVGMTTERVFLSDAKANGYSPKLDEEVKVFYNRFGKVDSIARIGK